MNVCSSAYRHWVTTPRPTAFHDLPASAFPVTIEYVQHTTGKVIRTEVIEGPGALQVPGLAALFGPIGVRMTWASGQSGYSPPPSGRP